MSAESKILYENDKFHLRSINQADIELLRKWKNKNKTYFFHTSIITVEQQLNWFESFCLRDDDHMYIVEELCEEKPIKVGVVGWRIKKKYADIYNIMRGERGHCDGYSMGQALRLMISYIWKKENLSIRCVVLRNNPALEWYISNGMEIVGEDSLSFDLEYQDYNNPSKFSIKE